MTGRICIIGGSSGLGSKVVYKLLSDGINTVYISRSIATDLTLKRALHIPLDLLTCSLEDISDLILEHGPFDGICFCQRFRPVDLSSQNNFIDEYRVMVYSISAFLESYFSLFAHQYPLSTVVVGSTYASSVGFDQSAGYHCSKAAQNSLVKFLSNKFRGRLVINMLSPPTFIKDGADQYWNDSIKSHIWNSLPSTFLPSVDIIADAIINILLNPNLYNTGNNILIDGGLSHLYFDQVQHFDC